MQFHVINHIREIASKTLSTGLLQWSFPFLTIILCYHKNGTAHCFCPPSHIVDAKWIPHKRRVPGLLWCPPERIVLPPAPNYNAGAENRSKLFLCYHENGVCSSRTPFWITRHTEIVAPRTTKVKTQSGSSPDMVLFCRQRQAAMPAPTPQARTTKILGRCEGISRQQR